MAKKKRQPVSKAQVPEVLHEAQAPAAEVKVAPRGPLSLKQYVVLNVVFDAFCVVQLVVARLAIQETRGLYFFFGLLMAGFLAVSVFDYVYDRICRAEPDEHGY